MEVLGHNPSSRLDEEMRHQHRLRVLRRIGEDHDAFGGRRILEDLTSSRHAMHPHT
jgi:hypothetical protein